jgi:protease I
MAQELKGRKVAMLATDGFEQVELTEPKKLLEQTGAWVEVIAPAKTLHQGEIRGWKFKEWGEAVTVDRPLDAARPEDYDALVLPGGVINPDRLRMDAQAVAFIRSFAGSRRPLAAICHGPQLLIEADLVRGRKLTSWPSLKTDLRNAGAQWEDREVVQDGPLTTSRRPEDIPAFAMAVIDALCGSRGQSDAA